MNRVSEWTKAIIIAIPIVTATPPSFGAEEVVDEVRAKVFAGQDFRSEMDGYLRREDCYAQAHQVGRASKWRTAIWELQRANRVRNPESDDPAFERAKETLGTARTKAGADFNVIMNQDRPLHPKEKMCLKGG